MVKIKQLRFFAYCLALGLIASMITVLSACSSAPKTTAALSSITILPKSPSGLPVGDSQQFIASGIYLNGVYGVNITSQVTWTSSNTSIVTISAAGLATAHAVGNASITASLSGVTSLPVTLSVIASSATTSTTLTSTTTIPASTTTTNTNTGTTTTP